MAQMSISVKLLFWLEAASPLPVNSTSAVPDPDRQLQPQGFASFHHINPSIQYPFILASMLFNFSKDVFVHVIYFDPFPG